MNKSSCCTSNSCGREHKSIVEYCPACCRSFRRTSPHNVDVYDLGEPQHIVSSDICDRCNYYYVIVLKYTPSQIAAAISAFRTKLFSRGALLLAPNDWRKYD